MRERISRIQRATSRYHGVELILASRGLIKDNDITGVEVGVKEGYFSEYLLQKIPRLFMELVDPYTPYTSLWGRYVTDEEQQKFKIEAAERLSKFIHRINWIYLSSDAAANAYGGPCFEFVYIDAVHTYAAVKTDLYSWGHLVLPGGVLCGHDFCVQDVKRAVLEYGAQQHKDVYHLGQPADVWYILV